MSKSFRVYQETFGEYVESAQKPNLDISRGPVNVVSGEYAVDHFCISHNL